MPGPGGKANDIIRGRFGSGPLTARKEGGRGRKAKARPVGSQRLPAANSLAALVQLVYQRLHALSRGCGCVQYGRHALNMTDNDDATVIEERVNAVNGDDCSTAGENFLSALTVTLSCIAVVFYSWDTLDC